MDSQRQVFSFHDTNIGDGVDLIGLLGGKGANLAEMTRIGIPVPPGFTISTECCAEVLARDGEWPEDLWDEVVAGIASIEQHTGRRFGDPTDPLLVSVRSGAAVSMPGMMDTVLNLGLTDAAVEGLAELTGNARFAWDAYRRLINMFGQNIFDRNIFDRNIFERNFFGQKFFGRKIFERKIVGRTFSIETFSAAKFSAVRARPHIREATFPGGVWGGRGGSPTGHNP